MNDRMDDILKQALTPREEPDFWLNQKILNQVKETDGMKRRRFRWTPGVVLSLAFALDLGTTGVYAAYRYLSAGQAAEKVGDGRLAEAFASEGAVQINETQQFDKYDVTFLGIVSGDKISELVTEKNGELLNSRTCAVVAVSRTDGTPFPEVMADPAYDELQFFVSPLITGCDPVRYNAATMNGSYVQFVDQGILYRLIECDNIEMFADRPMWLCVSDGSEYDPEAYDYDAESGEITRNESYEGVNALFELPVDPSLADPEAAEAYMDEMEPLRAGSSGTDGDGDPAVESGAGSEAESDEEEAYRIGREEADAFMEKVTPETIEEYAERLEESVQVFGAEEDCVVYRYETAEGREVGAFLERAREFPDGMPGMSPRIRYMHDENGVESLTMTTFTLNEDGTVTAAVWVPAQ